MYKICFYNSQDDRETFNGLVYVDELAEVFSCITTALQRDNIGSVCLIPEKSVNKDVTYLKCMNSEDYFIITRLYS